MGNISTGRSQYREENKSPPGKDLRGTCIRRRESSAVTQHDREGKPLVRVWWGERCECPKGIQASRWEMSCLVHRSGEEIWLEGLSVYFQGEEMGSLVRASPMEPMERVGEQGH